MRQLRNIIKLMMFGAVTAMALAACGGGGGDGATVPVAPAALTANAGNGQVTMNWTPVSGATSYNVYQGTAAGTTKATGAKVGSNITASTFTATTGLTNGTTYFFVVTAVNAAGESDVSAEKSATPSATPPPATPGNIRGAAGVGKATISWDTSAGATSYNIYYATSKGVTKTGIKVANAVSPQDVTLTNGTTYFFVVTAVNANGESATSFEVSAKPAATPPPAAPTGATATAGNGQVTVSWTAVAGAVSYNIYYAASTGVTKTGTKVAGAVNPQAVTGLTNGTTYFFVVTAVNANGESVESNQVPATPAAPVVANFTQADLAGTWAMNNLRTGSDNGGNKWLRAMFSINSSGVATCLSMSDSGGGTTCPSSVDLTLTMNSSTGVITQTGADAADAGTEHMTMTSNKNFIAGTGTNTGGSPNSRYQLATMQKVVPETSYTNAEFQNKSFVYHQLMVGADHQWSRADGTTDATGMLSLANDISPSGDHGAQPNVGRFSVDASGTVTIDTVSGFQGFLSADKKTIIGVTTESKSSSTYYSLMIIQITGQTYTAGPLTAETSAVHMLAVGSTPAPFWLHFTSTSTVASGGVITLSDWVSSYSGMTNPGTTNHGSISASGTVTIAEIPSFHGQVSHDGKFTVATQTLDTGIYALQVTTK